MTNDAGNNNANNFMGVVTKDDVTDKNGSEGIYAKFKLDSQNLVNIKVANLIVTGNERLDLENERKNIGLLNKITIFAYITNKINRVRIPWSSTDGRLKGRKVRAS